MRSPHVPWVDAVPLRTDLPQHHRFESMLRRAERRATTRIGRFAQKLTVRVAVMWISFSILFMMARYARNRLTRPFAG